MALDPGQILELRNAIEKRREALAAAVRCIRCQGVHEKTYAHPAEPTL